METTRGTKLAWLAFLLLQLALPSWGVIADARLLRAQPQSVHLESKPCVPSHPDDCAICSFLQTPVDAPAQPSLTLPRSAEHSECRAETVSRAVGAIAAAPLPRAPPQP
jgi:hypothetical protein